MPCDMRPYGTHWPRFSAAIRFQRANSRCECTGQCGLHHAHRCTEVHHTKARWAKGLVRLTVAHLCQCSPPCTDPNHVIAACQRCHLRIDRYPHAAARKAKNNANRNIDRHLHPRPRHLSTQMPGRPNAQRLPHP
jgi:hypothetical protein